MIKDDHLRNFVWVSSVGTIVFNLFVIIKNLTKMKSIVDKKSTKFYNLLFILNLSLSDLIFGFVLGAVAFKSSSYSGVYCAKDFEWRSSLSCNIIGVFTFISSQTSLNILVLTTGFRLYTVYKPYESLDIKKQKVYFFLIVCWGLSLGLAIVTIFLEKEFTQNMIISSNIFLRNKKANRLIKSNEFYMLAENIENIWNFSRPDSIPSSQSIYKVRSFKDWYFSSAKFIKQNPNIGIDIKMTFGFYSSSAVCLPDFYSKSSMASQLSFTLMSLNLFLITCISMGYVMIFYKIKSTSLEKNSKKSSKKEKTMIFRVSLIIATDIACWLPIIVFSYASFFQHEIPAIVHSITSILLLPINSLVNPILYSKIDVALIKLMRKAVIKIKQKLCIG